MRRNDIRVNTTRIAIIKIGEKNKRFTLLNEWITSVFNTEQNNVFTVMMRLSDKQYKTVYDQLSKYTQEYIDNKYPCGDGGWIHYQLNAHLKRGD